MRWQWQVVVVVVLLVCTGTIFAAETMRPYGLVKSDLDRAIADDMAKKGIIESRKVDFLVKKLKSAYGFPGFAEVVNDRSLNATISPSNIYVNSGLVNACKSDGELMGVLLHMYFHIANNDLGDRYDQVARNYNAFAIGAGRGPGSQENLALMKKIAAEVVAVFTQDCYLKADESAWRAMPELGYSSDEYTAMLERINGGRTASGLFVASMPARVAALKKLGPATAVEHPAKTMEEEEREAIRAMVKLTTRFAETDPSPFLAAAEKKPIEGWCYGEIDTGIYLFFDRGGKVAKKKKDLLSLAASLGGGGASESVRTYYLDDGKQDKATEMVVLFRNPSKELTHDFFIAASVGTEVGFAGLSKESHDLDEVEAIADDWAKETADQPRKWIALRMKVDDLEKANDFRIVATIAKRGNPKIRPLQMRWAITLLR